MRHLNSRDILTLLYVSIADELLTLRYSLQDRGTFLHTEIYYKWLVH